MKRRPLVVGHRTLQWPVFLPVTTFGGRFPLDELVRPYLERLAPALMVSYHYAQKMTRRQRSIVFIDSGGFASLFEGSAAVEEGGTASIVTKDGDRITPADVLKYQERFADIGATVDFIVPPDLPLAEAQRRQDLTIRNAIWALEARSSSNLRLLASVQAWDEASAVHIVRRLAPYPFDGFALGGMVPRMKRPAEIADIIRAVRSVDNERPLHVFGIGSPALIRQFIAAGADSFDSSSYVRAAVDGKVLAEEGNEAWTNLSDVSHTSQHGRILSRLGSEYLQLEGESNRMALALHNLESLLQAVSTAPTATGPPRISPSPRQAAGARSVSRRRTTVLRATGWPLHPTGPT